MGFESLIGPFRPSIVEVSFGEGATDWNALIGRASKNS